MKKRPQMQRMKWTPPKREQRFDRIFYFTVTLADDGAVVVQQVEDRPVDIDPEQDSILLINDQHMSESGIALNITWLNGKPAPESLDRQRGLVAVMSDIHKRLPEEDQVNLARVAYGLGHLYGAKALITEEHDDDGRAD